MHAEPDGYFVVVPEQGLALCRRFVDQPHELDIRFFGCRLTKGVERLIEIGLFFRDAKLECACSPSPLIDLRRGIELVYRRGKGQADAAVQPAKCEL